MKKRYKIFIRLLPALALLICLQGCFDRRELNTLGYVMGVAIDKAEENNETKVTLQLADVSGESEKSGTSTSKSNSVSGSSYFNVSNTGTNINLIIRAFEHKISRRIYMPHNDVIIFGEEFAKEGVLDSLDFFARAPEARMTLFILVAKGQASDVLEVEPKFEKIPAVELTQNIRGQKVTSQVPLVTEFEFITTMLSETTSPVAPMVEVIEDVDGKAVTCTGCAVFHDSKMIGELNFDETRGLLYVKDEIETGIMGVDVLNVRAAIEIRKSSSKVRTEIKDDGTIVFYVDVKETVGIGDQTGTINLVDPENIPILLHETEEVTRKEIQSAVDKSKELGADIFGVGEYISRANPKKWKEMKENWNELYQNTEVLINVKASLDGTGRSSTPLAPGEE